MANQTNMKSFQEWKSDRQEETVYVSKVLIVWLVVAFVVAAIAA